MKKNRWIIGLVILIYAFSFNVYADEFSDGTVSDDFSYESLTNDEVSPKGEGIIPEDRFEVSESEITTNTTEVISPEELHEFNYNLLNGISVAGSKSSYYTVWAIISTTNHGLVDVYSTATVPGATSYYTRLLQACLNFLGYNAGTEDGIYGTNTANAIRRFQTKNGLTVDGIAGEMTWRRMDIRMDGYTLTTF